MTPEARRILTAAAASNGNIIYLKTLGRPGVAIQAGGKSIVPDNASARDVASWVGGLEDLVREGYIRDRGSRGELFLVTREGYLLSDELVKDHVVGAP